MRSKWNTSICNVILISQNNTDVNEISYVSGGQNSFPSQPSRDYKKVEEGMQSVIVYQVLPW